MHPAALIDITAELLRTFRHDRSPSDKVLGHFLKEKRFLGSKERRFVGDTFFHCLRHLIRVDEALRVALENAPYAEWLNWRTGFPTTDPRFLRVWAEIGEDRRKPSPIDDWFDRMRIAIAAEDVQPGFLAQHEGKFLRDFPIKNDYRFPENRVRNIITRAAEVVHTLAEERKPIRFPIKHSIPDWLFGLLGYGLPPSEIDDMAAALNKPAPVSIRVNTLKTNRGDYLEALRGKNIEARESQLAGDGIVLSRRIATGDLPGFSDGAAQFQDEGSQFVTELIDPQPGMTIIDACAGGGGKSLHFAARMQNTGRIIANDISSGRLGNLAKRAESAGCSMVEIISPESPLSEIPQADIVLIDAPCSGTGTVRRSPELKYRLTRETLQERLRTQAELLRQWAAHVRPGGMLAYVTCSLLHEENGAQIDAFLAQNGDFARRPFTESGKVRRDMLTRDGDIQLHPHRHGCDGFFLARLGRG